MVPTGHSANTGWLRSQPGIEAIHGLLTLAKEAPIPGMNEKVTGRNFDFAFKLVRVRYDADSH
jgi:hypothetical protein